MNITKLILAVTIASAILVGIMPTSALAETTTTQNQKVEMECNITTGSYGQSSTNCRNLSEQRQQIKTRDGVKVVKKLLPTGLDTSSMSLVLGSLTTGAVALIAKRKLNA